MLFVTSPSETKWSLCLKYTPCTYITYVTIFHFYYFYKCIYVHVCTYIRTCTCAVCVHAVEPQWISLACRDSLIWRDVTSSPAMFIGSYHACSTVVIWMAYNTLCEYHICGTCTHIHTYIHKYVSNQMRLWSLELQPFNWPINQINPTDCMAFGTFTYLQYTIHTCERM